MTRAVRDRVLKDANGNISDHLRDHIHLTNCIHLKNHMHKHSPILGDRTLIRDLVALQRSRSLRDPSASPPSWHSPFAAELSKRGHNDVTVGNGRGSMAMEHQSDGKQFSGSSPQLHSLQKAKVVPSDLIRCSEGVAAVSNRSSRSGLQEHRRIKKDEVSGRSLATSNVHGNGEHSEDGNNLVFENSDPKDKKIKHKEMRNEDVHLKTLSERLNEVHMDNHESASCHIHLHGKPTQNDLTGDEAEPNIRGYGTELRRVKRRRFRGNRRTRAGTTSKNAAAQNEMSVASNSLVHGSTRPDYHMEERHEEFAKQNASRASANGCGIPWNWSSIHHRGKTFLDMAGRSLSCGLSDSRLKGGVPVSRGRDIFDMPTMSENSSSSIRYDAEAMPLLVEASGSQGSTDNAWMHDYSGELAIFSDNQFAHEIDSDIASEARYSDQLNHRRNQGRHQSLTQKYMPKTFRDLVGQNLVSQALANAVLKRKVGLVYVFHGPPGTGKTSCARVFARALNCQAIEHQKPCGFCKSCLAHDMGKSRNIREVGPVSNFDFESIMDLLDNMTVSQLPSQYRVFIFDDCDTMSPDCWSAISKVIDRAPRRVVVLLVCSSLDVLPHIIVTRCQKFFFPKLKDADIIYALQWIATKEDLEIDKDALKLITSRSDGSLRDAEMTLEQLSLLGQRISVPLVQELVGLVSDEKLVDLLDLALSADTINTVKNLREIMESGVEPLALMSQLATVITDILAGSYDLTKDRSKRKFFRRQPLSKEDMEKLRQALRTLSEAEKQLRISNDKITWLTAALLQLAPDQQYLLPSSSADTSFNHSPLVINRGGGLDRPRKSNVDCMEKPYTGRRLSTDIRTENFYAGTSSNNCCSGNVKGSFIDKRRHEGAGTASQQISTVSADVNRVSGSDISRRSGRPSLAKVYKNNDEIWMEVLEKIQMSSIKEFIYREGKLISVSFGAAAPTVQLMFSSHVTKSMAEKYRAHIMQAFELVLGSSVIIEIRCESRKDSGAGVNVPLVLPDSLVGLSQMHTNPGVMTTNRMPIAGSDVVGKDRDGLIQAQLLQPDSLGIGKSEIVEVAASPREANGIRCVDNSICTDRKGLDSDWKREAASLCKNSPKPSHPEERKKGIQNQSQSIVRSKVSLAHVIQQVEGCTQRNGWSKRKAVSIAEKLEQENLRLEPKSRSLLCWKSSRVTRRKLSRLKVRTRKPHSLLKMVSCGKCLSARSPR